VDIYVGATAIPDDDPRNQVYPGRFEYGGRYVIEDFVAGKETVNEAYLFNPRSSSRPSSKTRFTRLSE
jgi:L-aspartate semialdehyde sulfurtransferase